MSDYQDRECIEGGMENDHDLEAEEFVSKLVEQMFKCKLIKQQKFDVQDFNAVRGKQTVAWVEIRQRNIHSSKYEGLFMGYGKFISLSICCRILNIPAIFVVKFIDQIKFIDLTLIMPQTSYANRGKMKVERATDNEKCVLIPVNEMKELIKLDEQEKINRYLDQCPRPLASGQVKDTLTGVAHTPEDDFEVNPFESKVNSA